MKNKNHYYGIIKPYRSDFITKPNENDSKIMNEHFLYLKNLLNEGKLFLAGPTLNESDPFGLYIFETETIEEAKLLLEQDPSVKAGIQIIQDLRPIKISLYKGMEI